MVRGICMQTARKMQFEKVVFIRDGRLQGWALASERMVKQWKVVAFQSFRN